MDSISPDTPQKQCSKCPNSYPATREYFALQKTSRDGLHPWCKPCVHRHYIEHKEERKQREALRNEEISQYQKVYRAEHREEAREYNFQYHAAHKEEILQQRYLYRVQHREDLQKKSRQYRLEHKEYYTQYNYWYFAEHREELRQKGHQYHAKHREYRNQRSRQYHAEHREEARERRRRYIRTERGRLLRFAGHLRRRMHQTTLPGILSPEQIREKLKQQHYRCYYAACGFANFAKRDGQYVYHIEHTIPVSRTEHGPRHDVNYVVLSCPTCNLKKNNKLPHEFFEGGRLL